MVIVGKGSILFYPFCIEPKMSIFFLIYIFLRFVCPETCVSYFVVFRLIVGLSVSTLVIGYSIFASLAPFLSRALCVSALGFTTFETGKRCVCRRPIAQKIWLSNGFFVSSSFFSTANEQFFGGRVCTRFYFFLPCSFYIFIYMCDRIFILSNYLYTV